MTTRNAQGRFVKKDKAPVKAENTIAVSDLKPGHIITGGKVHRTETLESGAIAVHVIDAEGFASNFTALPAEQIEVH